MKLTSIDHTTPFDGNGLLTPISREKLIIVVNAGGEQGSVPDAYIIFR
jgi:hypothetical protein